MGRRVGKSPFIPPGDIRASSSPAGFVLRRARFDIEMDPGTRPVFRIQLLRRNPCLPYPD